MAVAITDVVLGRVGDQAYCLAVDAARTALEGQGLTTPPSITVSGGYNNGVAVITTAAASASHIGQLIFCDDDFRLYKIIGATASILYNIDRPYEGASGTHTFRRVNAGTIDSYTQHGRVWGGEI